MSDSVNEQGHLVAAIEAAQRWAIHDPEPRFRSAIDRLVDAGDLRLIELFDGRIAFGTAGLRAEVGPGPRRMNALVVRQTTVALVAVLRSGGVDTPEIVVGFDARHDSASFAHHAAAAGAAAGAVVRLASQPVPTPVLAHVVLAEHADAGVVITASHNPPADNGYKLYLGDGRQLVAPMDAAIAGEIDRIAASWHEHGPGVDDVHAELVASGAYRSETGQATVVDADTWVALHRRAAVDATAHLRQPAMRQGASGSPLRIVYTPMHGVGGLATLAAFEQAGIATPTLTESQFDPDPDFSTVAFPNPEEPGALDDALATADACGADAVFAHDPDADRLAIAVRSRPGDHLVPLSGDQLGVLLGDFLIRSTTGPRLVARSVVSSRLLDAVAEAAGVACKATLTGFKWIARAIDDHPERTWLFGYEEAIGYSIGDHVRDKDGITAALVAHAALAELSEHGRTVWDRFDELAAAHGVYETAPVTVRFDDDPAAMRSIIVRLEASPPASLGGSPVAAGAIGGGALPSTPGVELLAQDRTRVIVRPSGTEPKVKAYVEVIEPVSAGALGAGGVALARAEARARLTTVCDEVRALLRP